MLKDLKPNTKITDQLVIVSKSVPGVTANGSKYLNLSFQDNSGRVDAKLWDAKPEQIAELKKNIIIQITGSVIEYNKSLQVKVSSYKVVDQQTINTETLVKSAPVTQEALIKILESCLNNIKDSDYRSLTKEIVDAHWKEFITKPAAVRVHHSVRNGLLWHTVTMLKVASALKTIYSDRLINFDLLYCGVILHDIGKTVELNSDLIPSFTTTGKLIGHISIIVSEIYAASVKLNIDKEKTALLQHMVLASHGKYEFGSPVLPQIIEAEILHYIDDLDAKIFMINDALSKSNSDHLTERQLFLSNRVFLDHSFNKDSDTEKQ